MISIILRDSSKMNVSLKLLTSIPDTPLEAMFSGRHLLEEKDGLMLVDRDPTAFKFLIGFLKNRKKIPPNEKEKGLLTNELDFWGILSIHYLSAIIKDESQI